MTIATDRLVDEAATGSPDFPNGMPTVEGVPIVESGSNSDGYWSRWADGTQHCRGRAKNAVAGTGGNTYNPIEDIPFPRSFLDGDYYLGLTQTGFPTAAENDWSYSAERRVATQFDIVVVTPTSYPADSLRYLWFAEGRWK